jgi:hypothetical protein
MSKLKKREDQSPGNSAVPGPGADARTARPEKTIWDALDDIWAEVPDEELGKLPRDLAAQHDHYLYGLPKKAE